MQVKALLDALAKVKPGLAAKEIVEQSQSFIFLDGYVITYNDDIAVRHPVDTNIEGAVQADKLFKLLNKTKDEEVELETTEDELRIKGKKTKAGLSLEAEIKLPLQDVANIGEWLKLPKNFCEAIKFCVFSAGKDASRPILTCLNVKGKKVSSSDDFRLTRHNLSAKVKEGFNVAATACRQLVAYKPTHYAVSPAWVHFKSEGDTVFSTRKFEKEYPDLSKHLEVEGEKLKLPSEMVAALGRAEIFAEDDQQQEVSVDISISDEGKLKVRGEGPTGWFEERARVRYKGAKLKFAVNAQFLIQMLKHTKEVTVGENRLKFESDNFVHVVCLEETE